MTKTPADAGIAAAKYDDEMRDFRRAMAKRAAEREVAVDKAIAASNRAGRKIGKKEAKSIHRLLKGRTDPITEPWFPWFSCRK